MGVKQLSLWDYAHQQPIQWRDVVGYEAFYQVSEYGEVRRKIQRHFRYAGQHIKARPDRAGYLFLSLTDEKGQRRNTAVHRLVAAAFIGEIPAGMEVNHKDRNKQNNHHSNLEYTTHRDNLLHARAFGDWNTPKGERSGTAKLTAVQVEAIRALKQAQPHLSQRAIAAQFGVSYVAIGHILRGQTWRDAA